EHVRGQAAQRGQRGRDEYVKGEHRRNRVAGEAEEVFVVVRLRMLFAGGGARTTWNPAEHDGAAGLDLRAGEEEFGLEICEHLLDKVVLAHGNSTGEQEQIGFESVGD